MLKKNFESKENAKKDFLKFRTQIIPKFKNKLVKPEFSAQTNSIFVGEYNYPNVNVGFLSSEEYKHNDDSKYWVENKWEISKIAESRFDLVNSRKANHVKQTQDLTSQQEVALAKKPTGIDVSLNKIPGQRFSMDKFNKPMGPSAELKQFSLTENPSINSKIEKVVSDTDLKSTEGLSLLYKKHVSHDKLTQALTAGTLGVLDNRKLVPTKWGITAVDDTLGKSLLKEIRLFQTTGNKIFSGEYLGNHFYVLFFDGAISYELFEFFKDSPGFTTDYEDFKGRKNYASETAGGYYAARLPVLEYLKKHKRQTQALVLRFITDDYYMPLGVWVVRQAVTNAMASKPIEFGSEELMLSYIKLISKKKFGRDISWLKKTSRLLEAKKQKRVFDF